MFDKILNSDYKPPKITKDNEDESLVKRTLKKIIGLDEWKRKNKKNIPKKNTKFN